MSVGPAVILIILVVALLVFGPHRLPELARQVGSAMRELRKMQDTVRGELDMVLHPEHGTSSSPVPAIEPDDHSTIDAAVDSPLDSPLDSTVDSTSDAHVTGNGDDARDEPGFAGPSDSFI